jgi:hypothetical protein
MKTIKNFPVWFSKQRLSSRIFLIVTGVLFVACMCVSVSIFLTQPEQQSPAATETYQGADNVIFVTWTPKPATTTPTPDPSVIPIDSPTSTLSPTATETEASLPTGLPTLSLDYKTATVVVLPTLSRATAGALILITAVDKELEYVDIQNAGGTPADLTGWTLVSEVGNQTCRLKGILLSKVVLRIWAGTGPIGIVGINCGFKNLIWLNDTLDPAVLYNAKGEEVSRYPRP